MNRDDTDIDTTQELKETIDEIKACWQKGEHLDMPGAIERARLLVNDLEDGGEDAEEIDREDAIRGHVLVHDLYPRKELHERAIDDASSRLEQFGVPTDEARILWAIVEDGVLHYKIEHENIPTIDYGRSVDAETDALD